VDIAFWKLAAITFAAAFSHGFCGFGIGILLFAGLSFLTPGLERTSVVVTMLSLFVTGSIAIRAWDKEKVDWTTAAIILAGVIFGVPLGYAFVCRSEHLPLGRLVFGIVLILFCMQGWMRPSWNVRLPRWTGALFGALGGFCSGAFSACGPPLVFYVYLREKDPRAGKRTLQVVFLCVGLWRVTVVWLGPRGISASMVNATLLAAPVAFVGTWLGHRLSRAAPGVVFARAVYALLGLGGAVHLYRALARMIG